MTQVLFVSFSVWRRFFLFLSNKHVDNINISAVGTKETPHNLQQYICIAALGCDAGVGAELGNYPPESAKW